MGTISQLRNNSNYGGKVSIDMIMMVPSVIIILLCSVFYGAIHAHIRGWTMKYHSHYVEHFFGGVPWKLNRENEQ